MTELAAERPRNRRSPRHRRRDRRHSRFSRGRHHCRRCPGHRGPGPAVQSVQCDVSDAEAVSRLYAEIAGAGRQIDFAINAAGILSETPIIDMDVAEFDRTVAVNLRGTS